MTRPRRPTARPLRPSRRADDNGGLPDDGENGGGGGGGGGNGEDGQAGGSRSASGQDCCFNGQYLKCPNTAACFGGFDVNQCINACNGDFNCTIGCTNKLSNAPPPKGCTQSAPPPNVQCN
jgi:hypothetical protein